MEPLRFGVFGAGFWARYQLAAWKELPGAECVAIYNRTRARAERLAEEFGIPAVYDDPEALIREQRPGFLDVITDPSTHARFVELAVAHGIPVVCQKPMAPTLEVAERMVRTSREAGVPFVVHENWRWQTPIRELRRVLDDGTIGQPFRARIQYSSSFPVFDNQPFLKEVDRFILADMGSHILDVARFLFGEADRLCCQTSRIHRGIRGEDVATVMLHMGGVTCTVELSYASRLADERFPQTFVLVEGDRGSVDLGPDYRLRVTTAEGTVERQCPPPRYAWVDPQYEVVQASIVACNADVLRAFQTGMPAETEAEDNLRTVRLVFAAYESAATDQVIYSPSDE